MSRVKCYLYELYLEEKIVAHGVSNIKKKIRVLGSTSFEGTNITDA